MDRCASDEADGAETATPVELGAGPESEAILTARVHRRLLEHTLLERRTLLVLFVVLSVLAVGSAIAGLRDGSAAAGAIGGVVGALLRIRAGPEP
jgi:hypothetical protein